MTIPVLSYRQKGDAHVDLDVLIRSRMLIQANSGGGKSWALRQLLEETFGKVPRMAGATGGRVQWLTRTL